KQENVNLSGGRLEEGTQRYLVRTVNQFSSVEQMREMLLTTAGGQSSGNSGTGENRQLMLAILGSRDPNVIAALRADNGGGGVVPVRLKDVAEVRQGYKEREAVIRTGGREAVEMAVYKEGDANTVATADALEARLKTVREKMPGDIELTAVEGQSVFIRNASSDGKLDAGIGGLRSVGINFLFLRDGWSTFVISLSLPISIITTFFFMGQLGLSLNVMSLGGLALATGLVVDDSIVVLESIAKARERGLGVLESAIAGTREVFMAVVASTLTTIAVFLPLVFVEGIAGQLFRDQPMTVAIAIAVSLVVSMTLVPMLSALKGRPPMQFPDEPPREAWRPQSRWQKPAALAGRGVGAVFRYGFFAVVWAVVRLFRGLTAVVGPVMRKASDLAMAPYNKAEAGYLRMLPAALARPWPVLGVAAVAFAATLAVVPLLGADLIPQ